MRPLRFIMGLWDDLFCLIGVHTFSDRHPQFPAHWVVCWRCGKRKGGAQ